MVGLLQSTAGQRTRARPCPGHVRRRQLTNVMESCSLAPESNAHVRVMASRSIASTTSRESDAKTLLRVGDVARLTGKTVRAIHLYEELGLLEPVTRTR